MYTLSAIQSVNDWSFWWIPFWVIFVSGFVWVVETLFSDSDLHGTSLIARLLVLGVYCLAGFGASKLIPESKKIACLDQQVVAKIWDTTAELRSNGKTSTSLLWLHYQTPDGDIIPLQHSGGSYPRAIYVYKQNHPKCK